MGSYSSVAIRDVQGNIIGYSSTSNGQVVEGVGAPSQQYMSILTQQAAQSNRVVTGGGVSYQGAIQVAKPYDMTTAAGIASVVSAGGRGGAVDIRLAQKAVAHGMDPSQILVATGRYIDRPSLYDEYTKRTYDFVPIRENILLSQVTPETRLETGISTVPVRERLVGGGMVAAGGLETVDLYVPYGEQRQIEHQDVKIGIDKATGELAIYQQDYRGRWGLIGGGGRGALQSGMFTLEAATPAVFTQESGGRKYAASANVDAASRLLASPESYSRLGAEAYGGVVSKMSGALLTPESQVSRYESRANLANLVAQVVPGKAEAPGADIPWGVKGAMPSMFEMGPSGLGGLIQNPMDAGITTLKGGKVVAAEGVTLDVESLSKWEDYKDRFSPAQQQMIEWGALSTRSMARASFEMQKDTTVSKIEEQRQRVVIPYIGAEVPFISEFLPTQKVATYESGRTAIVGEGKTPFTTSVRKGMPEAYSAESDKVIVSGLTAISMFPGIGAASKPIQMMFGAEEAIESPSGKAAFETAKLSMEISTPLLRPITQISTSDMKTVSGFIPGTPEYMRDIYSGTREDPAKSFVSGGIALAIVGIGAGARAAGFGTRFIPPTVTAEGPSLGTRLYTGGSKVVSASMLTLYGSDIFKRTTGLEPGDVSSAFLGGYDTETGGIRKGGGIAEVQQKFAEKFPGLKEARRQVTIAETQELLPAAFAYSGGMVASDIVGDWARTKAIPKVSETIVGTRLYFSREGFPVSKEITTTALRQSFEAGTLVLETPGGLGRAQMAPYGTPLTRVPTGTQIGVTEPGTIRVFSGAEVPYLQSGGMIGETTTSEISSMFVSPTGLSYFTKPGSGPFGFGISSDILGIYRQPTMIQAYVKRGDVQEIPKSVWDLPIMGKSLNDPTNPRNIAITEFMRTKAEYGKVYVAGRGKSEWEGFIRPGTEVISSKPVGWYEDAGRRIVLQDVTFGGKAPGYEPSKQGTVVGKMFATIGAVSEGGYGGTSKAPVFSFSSLGGYSGKTPSQPAMFSVSAPSYTLSPSGVSPSKISYPSEPSYGVSYPRSGISYPSYAKPSYTRSPSSKSPYSSRISYPSSPSSKPYTVMSGYPSKPSYLSKPSYPSSPSSSKPYSPTYTPPYRAVTSTPYTPVSTPPYTPARTPPYTPPSEPYSRPYTEPVPPPLGGFGYAPGGSGYERRSPRSLIRWGGVNPVADIPYLSKGLSAPSLSGMFGGGPFGGTTKERTGRRSKYVRYRDRVKK